jgi:signal peptidase II
MKPSRLALLAYALAAVVVVADQATKMLFLSAFQLPPCPNASALDLIWSRHLAGPLSLSYVCNRGVSFGVFNADAPWTRWVLCGFSLVVAIGLIVWARRVRQPLLALALGFIIGGAVGNLIDRARLGAVTDFIDFSAWHFPWVFNVADAAINVGAALLLWDLFLAPRKRAEVG